MAAFFFLILFWVFFTFQTSVIKVTYASCHATKFGDYPFQINGFELLCKDNVTTIHFPSYGDLIVKSISHDTKKIDLLDPKNCVHHVFLNLNLSLTPFHYFYVLTNYTYLNCSTSLKPPFMEIPCLSASSYHVYTVDPALSVPGSCKVVKTVAIPFKYSPYLSDNSLGLRLTWDSRESEESKPRNQTRDSHTARNTVLGFSICLFVVATLTISIKVHASTRNSYQKQGQLLQTDF
ncbi:uncharacterized protein LOC133311289 [Gastrolobium bilobum]|uniref:uncharacterized protein LOC133311289 n=1 Tax=Gastrolobium bilobum TaxID=150636 RepID=UPI002AB1CE40|nr:uncharacterized protein LOC133311289 [Gastrolobium bilobum]